MFVGSYLASLERLLRSIAIFEPHSPPSDILSGCLFFAFLWNLHKKYTYFFAYIKKKSYLCAIFVNQLRVVDN